jgi:hypothetical protein
MMSRAEAEQREDRQHPERLQQVGDRQPHPASRRHAHAVRPVDTQL